MSKKLIAGFMAALMALVTAVSPVLAVVPTLDQYPGMLGEAGEFLVVVGADAKPSDVVAAVELGVRLAELSSTEVPVPGVAVEVEGKQKDVALDIEINDATVFGSALTWRQLPQLKETTITFKGKDYKISESLQVPASEALIKSIPADEADYLYLESPDSATVTTPIEYQLTFKKTLDENVSIDYPFVVMILGKEFSITDVDEAADKFTALVGEKATFGAIDESITVAGKTVTLKSAKDGVWGSFMVDGTSVTVDVGATKTVAEIKITVLAARVAEAPVGAVSVEIVAGTETSVTYGTGAEEEFPGAEDWKISADFATDDILTEADWIKVTYDPEESTEIKVGEKLSLPGDTLNLEFVRTTSTATADVSVKPSGSVTVYNSGDPDTKVTAGRSLDLSGTATSMFNYPAGSVNEYDKVWLVFNDTDKYVLAYYDAIEGKYLNLTGVTTLNNITRVGPVRLVLGEAKLNLTLQRPDYGAAAAVAANAGNVTAVIVPTGGGTNVTADFRYTTDDYFKLGVNKAEAETGDIAVGGVNRGTREYAVMTSYGIVVKGVESEADADRLTITIPNVDGIEATIAIGKVVGVAAPEQTYTKLIPFTAALAKLDTDLTAEDKQKNLIAVASPAVNKVSWEVLVPAANKTECPYPCYGYKWADVGVPIAKDTALIKVVESPYATGKVVIVVAGWEAEHTRAACYAMQIYDQSPVKEQLVGADTVKIVGATRTITEVVKV